MSCPASNEKFLHYHNRWKLHRVWVSKRTNSYVELRQKFLAVKLKMLKEPGDESYNKKEVNRKHKEELKKVAVDEAMEEEVSNRFVTNVNNLLHLFFPVLRYTSTINKNRNRIISMRTNHNCSNITEPSMSKSELCSGKRLTMRNVLMRLWTHLRLNRLFTRWAKCVCRPHIFKLYGKYLQLWFAAFKCWSWATTSRSHTYNLHDYLPPHCVSLVCSFFALHLSFGYQGEI